MIAHLLPSRLVYSMLMLGILTLVSCSSPVKYLGNTFPATADVRIYFNKADIKGSYEVIGKIYLAIEENTKDSKIQKLILDKARQHGGQAVIMHDLNRIRSGSISGGAGASTQAGKKSRIGVGSKKTKATNDLTMEVEVIRFN